MSHWIRPNWIRAKSGQPSGTQRVVGGLVLATAVVFIGGCGPDNGLELRDEPDGRRPSGATPIDSVVSGLTGDDGAGTTTP